MNGQEFICTNKISPAAQEAATRALEGAECQSFFFHTLEGLVFLRKENGVTYGAVNWKPDTKRAIRIVKKISTNQLIIKP